MTYRLAITETARKDLRRLTDDSIVRRINPKLDALCENPRPHGAKKLEADVGWSVRVGDYRIVYEIDDKQKIVTIVRVRSRQSAYDRS